MQAEVIRELQSEQFVTVTTGLTPGKANLLRAIDRLRKAGVKRILLEIEGECLVLQPLGKPERLGQG